MIISSTTSPNRCLGVWIEIFSPQSNCGLKNY